MFAVGCQQFVRQFFLCVYFVYFWIFCLTDLLKNTRFPVALGGDDVHRTTSAAPWESSTEIILPTTANATSTEMVTNATNSPPLCDTSRHFDGLSFVGGMVFAFGAIAILCFVRVLFDTRQESRYHLL